jgi:hypothetical protein
MPSVEISGLVAYPSEPPEIGETIRRAIETVRQQSRFSGLALWEENDVPGRFIANEVLLKIESGSVFVADVTRLNFNVVFEVGYAIGAGKRAFLVRNELLIDDAKAKLVGIFDTLGHKPYRDSAQLAEMLLGISDLSPLRVDRATNPRAPVYLVLPQAKGDAETVMPQGRWTRENV